MIPEKLKPGDGIRVIAPAQSLLSKFSENLRARAIQRLNALGLNVSYGKYIHEADEFMSTTVERRLIDLHEAFADSSVKAIMAVAGGTTSNQLLKYIDYKLIEENPKILCGISDITALLNAIFHKTGLVTYYGPHYVIWGASTDITYTSEYFKKCLFSSDPVRVEPAENFFNSEWQKREIQNDGYWSIMPGRGTGIAIGGNLLTLNHLLGSEFMPSLSGTILLVEDNGPESVNDFQNQLQSLINQPGFNRVRGMLIGRFRRKSEMTRKLLEKIIKTKPELQNIPVTANMDFGHTVPMATFPIGGTIDIYSSEKSRVEIVDH